MGLLNAYSQCEPTVYSSYNPKLSIVRSVVEFIPLGRFIIPNALFSSFCGAFC